MMLVSCSSDLPKTSNGSDRPTVGASTSAGSAAAVDLAVSQINAGHPAQAVKILQKASVDHPTDALILYNLAVALAATGDRVGSIGAYRKALAVDPSNAAALYNLAVAVTPTDRNEAIKLFTRAVKADPSKDPARLDLGLLLNEANRTKEAKEQFDKLIQAKSPLVKAIPARYRTP